MPSPNPKGRTPGAKQKITVTLEHWFLNSIRHIKETSDNPLVVMAEIMTNPSNSDKLRLTAAEALAKYIVPTLPQTMELKVDHFNNNDLTQEQLMIRLQQIQQELIAFDKEKVVSEQ